MRRATCNRLCPQVRNCHFYPRSPCGERPKALETCPIVEVISIHALLAESDPQWHSRCRRFSDFYPRSPCGERLERRRCYLRRLQISIHALLAESDLNGFRKVVYWSKISIHALLAESDIQPMSGCTATRRFLSTLSLRRATLPSAPARQRCHDISIHALLAESDQRHVGQCIRRFTDFYPRSPCGERRIAKQGEAQQAIISIHALLAESDDGCHAQTAVVVISIHALLAESDQMSSRGVAEMLQFLSTLSLRRATAKVHKTVGHFCAYETNFMGIASSC